MASKALRNLQITAALAITAQYDLTIANKTDIKTKTTAFSADAVSAGQAIVAAAQALYDGVGTVTKVTCYTTLSDPGGSPPWSGAGEQVDIAALDDSGAEIGAPWGDDERVPPEIASARDAFKAAVQACL